MSGLSKFQESQFYNVQRMLYGMVVDPLGFNPM